MDLGWIIQLASGAVGGNLAGAAMRENSLGPLGNSLAGVLGGGLGGAVLAALGLGGGGTEIGNLLASVASGGVGGGTLLAVTGVLRSMLAKA